MKKLFSIIMFVVFVFLGSTYFIGEMLQKELPKQLVKQNSSQIKTELISYHKSFLSAKMQLKVTLPIEGNESLQLLIKSDIKHYPYKATAINHITLLNSKSAEKIKAFFHEEKWVSSYAEFNLLGDLSGDVNLLNGSFENEHETLTTQPLHITYKYNLIDKLSEFKVNWLGFNGNISDRTFSTKGIDATYRFSHIQHTPLVSYQYQVAVKKLEVEISDKKLLLQGVALKGKNEISEDFLTVNTSNDWQVKKYSDGVQIFTDNHINLHLLDLDLNALTVKRENTNGPEVSQAILNDLLRQGLNIDLQSVHSLTPWGKVKGKLKMDIQPGMTLTQVIENPFLLIDYVNGHLDLSLPQKLSQQPELGDFLKMGTMSGVLKPEGNQLIVRSTLDRGELKINDRIIPM